MDDPANTFPVTDSLLRRRSKEELLNQSAKVIWMTGLSGSGKTTIAIRLERLLHSKGFFTQVFDADCLRATLHSDLDFSLQGRAENIRRIAVMSRIFLETGVIVINCFISPTKKMRQLARKIIGYRDFIEVYVNASLETCERRDPKGLYKKARQGMVKNFTGYDSPYETPDKPDIELNTDKYSIESVVKQLSDFIIPKIILKNK